MITSFIEDNERVKGTDRLVVEHSLKAEMKLYLNKCFCVV